MASEMITALNKDSDKMERNFMAERDRLVLELKKAKEDFELQKKNITPLCFQMLLKKMNKKKSQDLEKEIVRLELQLKDLKNREAQATEVINLLVKERIKMKNQLGLGVINAYRDSRGTRNNSCNNMHYCLYERMKLMLSKSNSREAY